MANDDGGKGSTLAAKGIEPKVYTEDFIMMGSTKEETVGAFVGILEIPIKGIVKGTIKRECFLHEFCNQANAMKGYTAMVQGNSTGRALRFYEIETEVIVPGCADSIKPPSVN